MKYSIVNAGTDCAVQKEAVKLLGKVFPDYWEQIAAREQCFPFTEHSFVARTEKGVLCGHVGVMPFTVSDGCGGILRMAGIASVAVDPAFRGQGISAMLCESAAEWAQQNGFGALPLFTGKFGVYANHGWTKYAVNPPQKITVPELTAKPIQPVEAQNLPDADKTKIIHFYEASFDFPGKVLRTCDDAFHSWKRVFREPEFRFVVTEAGYALWWDNAVVELCTVPDAELELLAAQDSSSFTLALPESHPVWRKLKARQWQSGGIPDDVYHGEGVMLRAVARPVLQKLYFPCADKF